jgi:hypothetical protein
VRRLFVVVEGETEELFVKRLLQPHLWTFDVHPEPINVAGGRSWGRWNHVLLTLLKSQPGDARFTTLFDLYALPRDFPGLEQAKAERDTSKRAAWLEERMKLALGNDLRLIPYLQCHEMEALLYVDLGVLSELLDAPDDREGLGRLRVATAALAPEDINDDVRTAPSRRLLAHIPSYRKTLHGPLVLEAIGLERLAEKCPRFGGWLRRLEALGHTPPSPQPM